MMDLFGLPIFAGVSAWQWVALALAYALAFVIKGVFGYGAVPPMVLMGSLIMPPHHAVLLAAIVNLASQSLLVPDAIRHGNRAIFGRMILFIMPAAVAGTLLFQVLSPGSLQLVVGVLLLSVLLIENSTLRARIVPVARARRGLFSTVAALIAGLIAGVVGAGAMVFLSVYLRTLLPEKTEFRGTVILIVTSILAWRAILLISLGLITWTLVAEALTLIPVAAAALTLGKWLSDKLSNDGFFTIYRWFMISAALLLIVRGLL